MAEHAHDLERVTRYGNGFSRFRCRFAGCDYWTDARDDEQTDELAHLRVEVARLTRENDTWRSGAEECARRRNENNALHALLGQLVAALLELRSVSCWCPCGPTELNQHDRSCEIASAAFAAAIDFLPK